MGLSGGDSADLFPFDPISAILGVQNFDCTSLIAFEAHHLQCPFPQAPLKCQPSRCMFHVQAFEVQYLDRYFLAEAFRDRFSHHDLRALLKDRQLGHAHLKAEMKQTERDEYPKLTSVEPKL